MRQRARKQRSLMEHNAACVMERYTDKRVVRPGLPECSITTGSVKLDCLVVVRSGDP
jgi:hypothetical protein